MVAAGNGFYHFGQDYIYASIRQPVELGHQTTHRYRIAQAAYDQQKWIVIQAELTAIVQTYRFFQTAAYRREKYQLAQELADFNDRLQETLERRMEANQVQPADVTLARVETPGDPATGKGGPAGLSDGTSPTCGTRSAFPNKRVPSSRWVSSVSRPIFRPSMNR